MSKIYVDEILPKDNATVDGSKLSAVPASAISSVNASAMPTGSIVQVQTNASIARTTITSSGSWQDTLYTQGIDPTSSSNNIFVNIMFPARVYGETTPLRGGFRVTRTINGSGTIVFNTDGHTEHIHVRNAANEHDQLMTISFIDSPGTTSTVTYTVNGYLLTGSTLYIFESVKGGFISLMEMVG